ncbi:hypothetical protein FVEG_11282 [Fusarium verticillioides 7600]|uniref:Small EDRK-rich factor-like N-terminal domain-containing protein n=1 Tax=Gibberella moniliformis (strain M3125 / FGSC 7600) TaxID=334819 RepID=W7MXP6_GIBM7|nr:hypothetical protein FVEG_11282 [Fusarium verticillioides 7600]EWG52560.1 hypothetical protein FVEG_11282 [Fusarium verticillioides 7600]RBQ64945.1 hypothetical protein FVER14953_11282 [Fusarium verticillioides]
MSRGNQRDLARAKNQAKLSGMKKGNQDSGVEMQKKKESDAEKMRRKQAASDARKAAAGTVGKK